ncbi:MAG: hypothetical protein WCD70_05990 [Alphaproteobacteria bacterium]
MSSNDDIRAQIERELAVKEAAVVSKTGVTASNGGVADKAKAAYGAGKRMTDWARAAYQTTARRGAVVWSWLDPIVEPILRGAIKTAPYVGRGAKNAAVVLTCKKDKDGNRHFDAWYTAKNIIKLGLVATATPIMSTGAYYYSTLQTYNDVYVPSSGVFVNEQFLHASKAGQTIAPRDEIFTVLGKQINKQGKVEPVRFDIDTNWYFFFDNAAMRPDLAASRMDSQSPLGEVCTVQATGFYTRLPRYIRVMAVKWLDLRAEIVNVEKCNNVLKLPAQFYNPSDMEGSLQPRDFPKGTSFTLPQSVANYG